jgi:HSP20 family molecular chaperone IbpA
MESSHAGRTSSVRLSKKLGKAYRRLEDQIRERAYHLSLFRDADQGDPVADWLEAESQLLESFPMEVKEQRKNTVVEVKLKDFTPEDIEIEVAGNVLRIFGSHTETNTQKKRKGGESTSKTQSFFRSVPLATPVDLDHSHAKLLKNGKLKVVLSKKTGGKPKQG